MADEKAAQKPKQTLRGLPMLHQTHPKRARCRCGAGCRGAGARHHHQEN